MSGASRRTATALTAAIAAVALVSAVLIPGVVRASHTQQSFFQDDAYLIYSPTLTVENTLARLQSLGVQRIRVNLNWALIAPQPTSRVRPAHFDATDPAAYGSAGWAPYDRLVELAPLYHMAVDFDIGPPGPLWAMRSDSPTTRAANHWMPNTAELNRFVIALGRRYSGSYASGYAAIPRVQMWSIWNEPNQPGWLAPQWRRTASRQSIPASPALYRGIVRAAFSALTATGHHARGDTILIGELAPEGSGPRGFYNPMPPMVFLRALYCVDGSYRPLRGTAASLLGCPKRGPGKAFRTGNPGLFDATAFAHHPYYFFRPPASSSPDADFVPIANLSRLEHGLDRAMQAYGVSRRIPLYLTEYGYQTNPPDPYELVSPAAQAVYLNQADYMAWGNPRVRSVSQFLLYDSQPDARFKPSQFGYWDTFQTGLLYADGRPKPAYAAYRMPIWIPQRRLTGNRRVLVWGQLRAAPRATVQRATIMWRAAARGAPKRILATVTVRNPEGYFTSRVRVPGPGTVWIAWRSQGGGVLVSRSVTVTR
jgi:hypothetical protein